MRISDWSSDVCSSDLPQALTVRADRVDRSALYLALAGFTFRSIAKRNAIRESDAMAGDVSALFTFDEFLTHWAEDRPDRVAMREEGRVFTYGEIEDRTARVASALLDPGLKMGARIAWIGNNRDLYFTLFFGAAPARIGMAPHGWRLSPGSEARRGGKAGL